MPVARTYPSAASARLFVVVIDDGKPLFVPERVVQVHRAAARDAEQMGDAVLREKIRDVIRDSDFHFAFILRSRLFFLLPEREVRMPEIADQGSDERGQDTREILVHAVPVDEYILQKHAESVDESVDEYEAHRLRKRFFLLRIGEIFIPEIAVYRADDRAERARKGVVHAQKAEEHVEARPDDGIQAADEQKAHPPVMIQFFDQRPHLSHALLP